MSIIGNLSLLILALLGLAAGFAYILPEIKRRLQQRRPRDVIESFLGYPEELTTISRTLPLRAKADLQRCLDTILTDHWHVEASHGITNQYDFQGTNINSILDAFSQSSLATPSYTDLDIGEEGPIRCLDGSLLLLVTVGDKRLVALIAPAMKMHQPSGILIEFAMHATEAGAVWCNDLLNLIERHALSGVSYRGKILSLEAPEHCGGAAAAIQVHHLSPVERSAVILPETVLEAIEHNIIDFAASSVELAKRGLSQHKGVLLYGPPGTGKTYCIRHLAHRLSDHTTLLVDSGSIAILEQYMALARQLQPAMIVVEDVDLIARHRDGHTPGRESLLNTLLNEMDGLRPDAEIIFILTTNQPETIEGALAARPGRVDQAILLPLPGDDQRQALIALYGGDKLCAGAEAIEELVRRTDGCSAAFIKELIRRSAQFSLERDQTSSISHEDIDNALEEILVTGGILSQRLLGGKQVEAG